MDYLIQNVDPKILDKAHVHAQCPICSKSWDVGFARPFPQSTPDPSGKVMLEVPGDAVEKAVSCSCGADYSITLR